MVACVGGTARSVSARADQTPTYTREEYDAYMAAHAEKDPQQKIKLLDEFVAKYPKSQLMVYIYNDYKDTYAALKDYPKAIDSIDKLVTIANLDPIATFQARLARAQYFLAGAAMKELNTPAQLTAARDSARQTVTDLETLKKPEAVSDADWTTLKTNSSGILNSVISTTSKALKDFAGEVAAYKALLAIAPNDAATYSRMGVAYLQMNPPQAMDGMWALARAIALKVQGEAQVRAYLRGQVQRLQGGTVQCENLTDDQVNQMVALAGGAAERPASFTLPTADDLQKARDDTANFIPYLREGGEHGKLMWLATCGLDYPEIVAKVISVDAAADGSVVLHLFTGATKEETDAGTVADMEVKIVDQPDAKKAIVGDELRFAGTLTSYDQTPFMLHWEKGKVNVEDLPKDTKTPPKKKPGGKL
jgi:tetratricopeptide (TPR) repeat protein